MSHGYSVAQTAQLVCALRWACGRLSEMLAVWAGQAAADGTEHADAAVRMAELSRGLASHREALDGLQPDSELLAPWRCAAPANRSLAEALDEITALEGPLERLDVVTAVIVPELLGAYGEICEHAAPHCDAALASVARSLGHDLDRDHRNGGAATAESAQRGAVEAAGRLLSTAGGIVGQSVLRTDGWS